MAKNNETKLREVCEKCGASHITEELIEAIAETAAQRAVLLMRDHFYQGVGAQVINRALQVIGAITFAAALWLASKGFYKWL